MPVRAGGTVLGVLETRWENARERELDWVAALADVASLLALFLKRQRAEADLQRFARYDSLTGLPNRSFFLDTLERTLSRAGRQRTRSALVFLDLDGFKAVNDGLGHAAGDSVLQTMAERLRSGTRPSDLEARIGGDEFTVLLQQPVARRRRRARDARPARPAGEDVPRREPRDHAQRERRHQRSTEDGTDADTLLRNADPRCTAPKGRQEYLPLLHGRDERARVRAHAAARQPEERPRAGRVRDRVSAGAAQGPAALARGAPALAPPEARPGRARLVHRAGRGQRADAADRRRRAPRGDALLRLARPEGRARGRQPVGAPVPAAGARQRARALVATRLERPRGWSST